MTEVRDRGLRSYVSEPDLGRRNWRRNPDAKKPTYANRRRIRGDRGKRLLRQRGEKLELGFAHILETGGLRRVHVRGREEIRKRILIQAAAFNLGLLMRSLNGIGTPRGLPGLAGAPAAIARRLGGCHRARSPPRSPPSRPSERDCWPCNRRDPPWPHSPPGASISPLFHGLLVLSPGRGTRRSLLWTRPATTWPTSIW